MTRTIIIRNRATQDVRQQANYILVNGNTTAATYYLEMVELTFEKLISVPSSLSEITNCRVGTAHEGFQSMYDCPKSRFQMMSNHIDARSWAVPTLQNDLNAVTVSITDYYPDRLLE
jgi:hypothetical protein